MAPIRLTPDDVGELFTLQRAAYIDEARSHGDLELPPLVETIDQIRAICADPTWLVLGLRDDHRLVASVRLHDADEHLDLARLMVAPDRQGEGLARRLLTHVDELAAGRTIRLITGEYSQRNLAIYANDGYREIRRFDSGAGYDLVELVKATRAIS